MRTLLRLLLPAAVLTAGLATAPMVAAASPVRLTISVDDRTDLPTFLCGFPLERHVSGTLRIMEFVDADGTIRRTLSTSANFRVTFTNLSTGATYSHVTSVSEHATFHADGSTTVVLTGLLGRVSIPGAPPASDVGRLVLFFDASDPEADPLVSQAGRWTGGPFPALCDVLS